MAGKTPAGIAVAALGLILLCLPATSITIEAGQHEQTPARGCDVPSSLDPVEPTAATQAPAGGGIQVVEKGFTQTGTGVSAGAILENTSTMAAYRTRIVLVFRDTAGVTASFHDSPQLIQEVPIILPGQRIGIGSFAYAADRPGMKAVVASFDVELKHTQWVPRHALGSFHEATGRFIQVHRFDPADPAAAYMDYTVTISSCRTLQPRMTAAVYRNRHHTVIGGTLEASAGRGRLLCQPGRHTDWISAHGMPSTADPTRTELYPYCDLAPQPESSTPPWN